MISLAAAEIQSAAQAAEEAARAAGQVLLNWRGRFAVQSKGPADFVTQADLESQETLKSLLIKAFPQFEFLGEEAPDNWQRALHGICWVADPLDGTTNFVHGVPHYAVSLALLVAGSPVLGVIFDPNTGECFTAQRGQGAFLRSQRLAVGSAQTLDEALISASFAAAVRRDCLEVKQFQSLIGLSQGVRRTGSAALNLAYVAAGRYDAFWSLSTKLWDVAAGVLLIEEAGGIVTELDSQPLSLERPHPVASCTSALHRAFLAALTDVPA